MSIHRTMYIYYTQSLIYCVPVLVIHGTLVTDRSSIHLHEYLYRYKYRNTCMYSTYSTADPRILFDGNSRSPDQ